jgi:hypothetical protein
MQCAGARGGWAEPLEQRKMPEYDTSLLAAAISKSESIAKDVEELFTLAEQLEQTLGKGRLAYTRVGRTAARAIAASARPCVRCALRRKQHARRLRVRDPFGCALPAREAGRTSAVFPTRLRIGRMRCAATVVRFRDRCRRPTNGRHDPHRHNPGRARRYPRDAAAGQRAKRRAVDTAGAKQDRRDWYAGRAKP